MFLFKTTLNEAAYRNTVQHDQSKRSLSTWNEVERVSLRNFFPMKTKEGQKIFDLISIRLNDASDDWKSDRSLRYPLTKDRFSLINHLSIECCRRIIRKKDRKTRLVQGHRFDSISETTFISCWSSSWSVEDHCDPFSPQNSFDGRWINQTHLLRVLAKAREAMRINAILGSAGQMSILEPVATHGWISVLSRCDHWRHYLYDSLFRQSLVASLLCSIKMKTPFNPFRHSRFCIDANSPCSSAFTRQ